MDEKSKKEFIEEFKKADGARRLDMWDYAIQQQVLWENIIADMQRIAREHKIDKKLDYLIEKELKEIEKT